MTKKKPTKKEIESVISNMIREIEFLGRKTYELSTTFVLYLDWKKEKDTFNKFIEEEVSKAKSKFDDKEENIPGETK